MTDEALTAFRSRFEIPIPDKAAQEGALYRPPEDSPEIQYMQERRKALGGYLPKRDARKGVRGFEAPVARGFQGIPGRLKRPRGLNHHGLREHAAQPDEASESR